MFCQQHTYFDYFNSSLNYLRLAFACCHVVACSNIRGGIRKLVGEASNNAMGGTCFCGDNSPNGFMTVFRDSL